jgi:hypothetical protein
MDRLGAVGILREESKRTGGMEVGIAGVEIKEWIRVLPE